MTDNVLFFLKFKNTVQFFYDNITIREALVLMKEHGFTAVPVIDNKGVYVGSVSEGDFLWYLLAHHDSPECMDSLVRNLIRPAYMPAVAVSVSFDELLNAALHQNYVPVVDDRNIFIGIVTRQTLLNYLMDQDRPAPILLDPAAKQKIQSSLSSIL